MNLDDIQQEIENLKSQVTELLQWKADREHQQLTQPLDPVTKQILKTTLNV